MDTTFDERLNMLLTHKKVGTNELARQISVSASCVTRYRTGESFPPLRQFIAIIGVCKLNSKEAYWLLTGKDEE